ncbi:MAG TPA: hypothetical protein VEI02_15070 [Planctomycetota bacterium]|nr:hypothetical protein [Planctomycetota bacterium]
MSGDGRSQAVGCTDVARWCGDDDVVVRDGAALGATVEHLERCASCSARFTDDVALWGGLASIPTRTPPAFQRLPRRRRVGRVALLAMAALVVGVAVRLAGGSGSTHEPRRITSDAVHDGDASGRRPDDVSPDADAAPPRVRTPARNADAPRPVFRQSFTVTRHDRGRRTVYETARVALPAVVR